MQQHLNHFFRYVTDTSEILIKSEMEIVVFSSSKRRGQL